MQAGQAAGAHDDEVGLVVACTRDDLCGGVAAGGKASGCNAVFLKDFCCFAGRCLCLGLTLGIDVAADDLGLGVFEVEGLGGKGRGLEGGCGAVGREDNLLEQGLVVLVVIQLGRCGVGALRDALFVKLAVAEVHTPVGGEEDEVQDVDDEHPVDGAGDDLGCDAGKVADGDQHDELPARACGSARLVVLVGVGRPGQAKADEHCGFEHL